MIKVTNETGKEIENYQSIDDLFASAKFNDLVGRTPYGLWGAISRAMHRSFSNGFWTGLLLATAIAVILKFIQ